MLAFYFNNKHSLQEQLYLKERPIFPVAEEEEKNIDVLNRTSGSLTIKTGKYKDIKIELKIRAVTNQYRATYDKILKWINHIEDKRLYFSEDKSKTYIVKTVKIKDIKCLDKCFDFSLDFICEPFLKPNTDDKKQLKSETKLVVETDLDCPCLIELENVLGTDEIILEVNGNAFVIYNPIGDVIIDSNLMACYKKESYTNIQTSSSFPVLRNGENIIKVKAKNPITGTIKPLPLWRY